MTRSARLGFGLATFVALQSLSLDKQTLFDSYCVPMIAKLAHYLRDKQVIITVTYLTITEYNDVTIAFASALYIYRNLPLEHQNSFARKHLLKKYRLILKVSICCSLSSLIRVRFESRAYFKV